MPRASERLPVYLSALTCLAVFNWSLVSFIGLPFTWSSLLLLMLFSACCGFLLDSYPRYLGLLTALLILSLPLWLRYYPAAPAWVVETVNSSWVLLRDGWLKQVEAVNMASGWALAGLGSALFAWAVHRYGVRLGRVWVVITLGLVWLALQWIWGFAPAASHLAWFLVTGLTFFALASARQHWGHSGFESSRPSGNLTGLGLQALTVAVLLVTASHLAPTATPTWHWGELGNWVVRNVPALAGWQGEHARRGPVDLLSGSWGSSAQLGGPLSMSGRPLLRLQLEGDVSWPIYLREAALLTYTGRGWSLDRSRGEWKDFIVQQRLPMLVSSGAPLRYTITTLEHNIWYLPVIYDADRLSIPVQVDDQKNLIGYHQLRAGQKYTASSRQVHLNAEAILSGDITPYPHELVAPYLQLPALPAEVRELVQDLISSSDHDYERALILEAFLRQQYPYRLDVPIPPAQGDFVAHFLFDLQEGYCSYHASAMAVMLRVAGIPSRWVQGFRIDEPDEEHTSIIIDSDRAHAWVEAYFPGYGWLVFEPTPSYPLPRRDSALGSTPGAAPSPDNAEWDIPIDDLGEYPFDDDLWAEDPDWDAPGQVGTSRTGPFLWLLTLLALTLSLFTYVRLQRDQLAGEQGVKVAYARGVQLLQWSGLPMHLGETAGEYAGRVADHFPTVAKHWQGLADGYSLAIYSLPPATAYPNADWKQLLNALREQLGTWSYARTRLLASWRTRAASERSRAAP